MQLLLSCAKTMSATASFAVPRLTQPFFGREAGELAAAFAQLTAPELARVLGVNPKIAAENRRRFLEFEGEGTAAVAAYTGIVFRHLAADRFSDEELQYAQDHLNITSFLYGLLRPTDAIRPYRMEGGVAVPDGEGTLFDFWRERLTGPLIERVKADDGILLNLASGEMKRLFDWPRVAREVRILTPEFRVREGGRLKTVVVYTKMCRGEMARFVLKHRTTDPEALRTFAWEGFRYDEALSRPDRPVYTL